MLFRLLLGQLHSGRLERLQALRDPRLSALGQAGSHCQINLQCLMPFFNLALLYDAFWTPDNSTKLLMEVTRVHDVLNLFIFDPDSTKVLGIHHHTRSCCFQTRSLNLRLQCLREGTPMHQDFLEFCTLLSYLLELLQSRFHLRTTLAWSSSWCFWSCLYEVFDYFRFCYWHFL